MQPIHAHTQVKEILSLVARVDHACTKGFLSNENALKTVACITIPL